LMECKECDQRRAGTIDCRCFVLSLYLLLQIPGWQGSDFEFLSCLLLGSCHSL
jgi:hypothetical protein